MNTEELTPEKSFELITQIISEAKSKFEENGFIYIFWGVVMAIVSISQYILLINDYNSINYYPYFIMPLGGIYTWYYFSKKESKKSNQLSNIVALAWLALSLNIGILGFLFAPVLKENLIPILLILIALGIIISGVAVKSKILIFSGIFMNISALICFKLEWIYHPLLMGIVSIIAVLIPGLILMIEHKKKQNVSGT